MSQLSLAEQVIHSTIRIECFDAAGIKSSGTGFFFRFLEQGGRAAPAIVTNKHVFEGAQTAAFHLTLADASGRPIYGQHERVTITNFAPTWFAHPDADVDLAVLPIAAVIQVLRQGGKSPFFMSFGKSELPTDKMRDELNAIEEVTMIGYPNGIWDSVNNMPIVRRGITATPLLIDYEGRREFVIDAACFPGSSGSPIVLLNQGTYATKNGITMGERFALLGVLYAGPQHNAEGEIIIVDVPTVTRPIPISRIPNNLGYCIKSDRLLEFEAVLQAADQRRPSGAVNTETI